MKYIWSTITAASAAAAAATAGDIWGEATPHAQAMHRVPKTPKRN